MALDADHMLTTARRVLKDSEVMRVAMEAHYGLAMLYGYGEGTGHIHGYGGGYSIDRLRPVMNADGSGAVRTCINRIRSRIRKEVSRIVPRSLDWTVEPASGATNDLMAALVGDKRLKLYLDETAALKKMVRRDHWRCVLGSCMIRRRVCPRGKPIAMRGPSGEPLPDREGKPRWLWGGHDFGWMVCPPYEFIRDPTANSIDFDDETCIGHEKPVPVSLINRAFGLDIKTDMTMGRLVDFQEFIAGCTTLGASIGSGFRDSRQPGVMLSEWWFTDDEPDRKGNEWPGYMLAYRDAGARAEGDRQLQRLHAGPNFYHHLPIHHYVFDEVPGQPIGEGIATQVMQQADIWNVAMSIIVQEMIFHGGQRYDVIADVLADNLDDAIRKLGRPNEVMLYKPGTTPDKFIRRDKPAALDQNAAAIVGMTAGLLDDALGQSEFGRGMMPRRTPVGTVKEVVQQADTVIDLLAHTDELITNDLLTGSLWDVVRNAPLKQLREELSGDFDDRQIRALLDQDKARPHLAIKVMPDTLRPQTRDETRKEYAEAVQMQMLDAQTARLAMFAKNGFAMDPDEGRAWRMQQAELLMLLRGEPVEAEQPQKHHIHKHVLSREMESPRWLQYRPEQRAAILAHWREHEEHELMLQGLREPASAAPQEGPEGAMGGLEAEAQGLVMPQPGGQGTIPFPQQAAGEAFATPGPPLAGAPDAGLATAMSM